MFNAYVLERFAAESQARHLAEAQLARMARAGRAETPAASWRLRTRLGDALIAFGSRLKARRQPRAAALAGRMGSKS